MISSYLQGGLGNQMFQIAAAVSLAKDNNTEAIFDTDNHDLPKQGRKCEKYLNSIFRNIKFSKRLGIVRAYHERSFGYEEIPYVPNTCLMGYFQSEKYFIHNQQLIRDLFSIDVVSKEIINEKYSEILNKNPVGVHVRRGDYLFSDGHHPLCTKEYYEKAFSTFPEDTTYLFVSDDIGWCKQNFIGKNFHFVSGNEDYVDLFLMSKCRHDIIANSSFSWWAAWLNENKEKRVITPQRWFATSSILDTRDLIPQGWKKI